MNNAFKKTSETEFMNGVKRIFLEQIFDAITSETYNKVNNLDNYQLSAVKN